MDLFLAQLFGLYFVIVGVAVLVRRKSLMPAVRELVSNKPVLLTVALLEIAAGLAIVLSRPVISWDWMGIISIIGWMLLVEGILYLLLPAKAVQKFARNFSSDTWTLVGGIVAAAAGAYLSYIGFGLGAM